MFSPENKKKNIELKLQSKVEQTCFQVTNA